MDSKGNNNLDIDTFPELIKPNVYEAYTSYYNTIERADGTSDSMFKFPLWLLLTLIIITIFVGLWLWWSIGGYKKKSKYTAGFVYNT